VKFFIATDHAGIEIKPDVITLLQALGHEVDVIGLITLILRTRYAKKSSLPLTHKGFSFVVQALV